MKDRGNKQIKLDSLFKSSFGRYVTPASRSHFTISNHRLRWAVDGMRFTAPLPRLGGNEVVVKSPLSRGGHTQIAGFGAFFKKRWQAWWLCPFWT